MIQQKKSNSKKKYLLQFSPFFWRLGNIDGNTIDKDAQLSPVFANTKESR